MQTTVSIPASIASYTASSADGAGTKTTEGVGRRRGEPHWRPYFIGDQVEGVTTLRLWSL
jgi:hypothetical protein